MRGQLIPISGREAKTHKSKVAFVTEDGRKFFIDGGYKWDQTLWRHIWDYVNISGVLNLTRKTIIVQNFFPAETEYKDEIMEMDYYRESNELNGINRLIDLVRKGGNLQSAPA